MGVVIVGLDPSSKKLAFVLSDERGKALEVALRNLPDPAKIDIKCSWAERFAYEVLVPWVKKGHRVILFIEEPLVGRGGARATILQARVSGAVLCGARRAGVREIHDVNQSRWKKIVLGAGNYPKKDIPRYVKQTWQVVYDLAEADPDLCDAACINAYGVKALKIEQHYDGKQK
jgi:Holliday junction resolvasome RuvABC endonuclease subunit